MFMPITSLPSNFHCMSMTHQIWSPDGAAIQTTNHHNKQVESLLVTPMTAGGSTEASGKIWTCAADGTVYFWTDATASGKFDSAAGKSISVPGNKRKGPGHWFWK